MRLVWLMLLGILAGAAQAGEAYRWVDADGTVHYGDRPPADSKGVQTRNIPADNPDAATLEAIKRKQRPVVLYVAPNCAEPCQLARDFLKRSKIPFSEKNLVSNEEILAFKEASKLEGVPALAIGTQYLNGFEAGQWRRELKAAGYKLPDAPKPQE